MADNEADNGAVELKIIYRRGKMKQAKLKHGRNSDHGLMTAFLFYNIIISIISAFVDIILGSLALS